MPTIYLIPTPLGDSTIEKVLPAELIQVVATLRHFVVENIRTSRRHLKRMVPEIVIVAFVAAAFSVLLTTGGLG